MNEWINISKKPPPKDIAILVETTYTNYPYLVKWMEKGGFWEPNDKESFVDEYDMLRWMPLPEKPK